MFSFQHKITRPIKKEESLAHSKEQNKWTENVPEETEILDLLHKDFKKLFRDIQIVKGDMNTDRKNEQVKISVKYIHDKKEIKSNSRAKKHHNWNGNYI